MSHPQLRSNKPFPHHRCTRHHHRARRCTPHCPPSQRGQGTIYSHLHPRSARSPSPSRCMSSPYHPRPSIPLPSLCCHNVQIGVHSDLNKTKINCIIVYCGRTITCGHKCTKTGLWTLMPKRQPHLLSQANIHTHMPNQPWPLPSTLMPHCLQPIMPVTSTRCSLPSATLITITGLTPTLIKNHLPRSTATDKGHMRQHRSNTASTRKNHNDIVAARAEVDHMFPQHKICTMQDVFCFAALANTITGTMYTDITSAFPVCSLKSMQYIFVAYVYDLNAIIVRAMASRTDASMATAFTEVISTLKTGGYHPALNVMDNECLAAVEKYIRSEQINIQRVPPLGGGPQEFPPVFFFRKNLAGRLSCRTSKIRVVIWQDRATKISPRLFLISPPHQRKSDSPPNLSRPREDIRPLA